MQPNAPRRTAKLDQLSTVERGRSRHRPRNAPHLYDGPYHFIQTGEVKAADFWIHGGAQTYSEAGLEQSRLWPSGTICVTIAANIAESGMLAVDSCFPDSVVGVTAHVEKADPSFLKYALDHMKLQLQSVSGGTTQDNLSLAKLLSFDFPAPAITIQRQIAGVLRSFDDLIENNRRRIEILEDMARLLYREWFVHFRFPGREDVNLVDSDLGPIPEGWSVGEYSDLVSEGRQTIPPNEIPYGAPVVGLEHLPRRSTTLQNWESASTVGSRRKIFEEGDILFAKIRPYFHKVVDAPFMGHASTDAIVFRPKSATLRSRALAVASSDDFVSVATATSNGTRMPRANTGILMSYRTPHPTPSVDQAFNEAVAPMDALRKTLAEQSRCLREARDLLLPRLVSGELDVSELDLNVEAVGV